MVKKVKILQFPIANSNGGITHYALNNWKRMDKSKFECDFATMSKHLDFEAEILETGSRVHYLTCYAEDDREQFIKEFHEILDIGYDVVHLHTRQWKSFLVEELCKEHHIPKVIVHSHSTGIEILEDEKREHESSEHERVKALFNESLATDFWACSELAADFLFGQQINRKKIKIIPNAIDIDKFAFNEEIRNNYRREYGLEDCFVIGHVGRFEYSKNHEFLIDVFSEISTQIDYARLVLIGEGNIFIQIQEKVKKLKLNNKVLFLGKRNDVNNWYQAMDVFCLPSHFEGLPIVLIEAQASGLPCIGSITISKEVRVSENVFLIPLKEEQWIQKIVDCLKEKRKDNMRCLADAGYDIKVQIKNIEDLLLSMP